MSRIFTVSHGSISWLTKSLRKEAMTQSFVHSILTLCLTRFLQFGSTAIGVKTNEGVILGVEKKLQSAKLMVPSARSEKLVEMDRHCACAMSGIVGDARILIDHGRVEAQNHAFNFNEPMGVEAITQSISDLAINFGEGYEGSKRKPMSRPYGVALLIGGVDERGPQLYATDPSGTYTEWQANAIGAG